MPGDPIEILHTGLCGPLPSLWSTHFFSYYPFYFQGTATFADLPCCTVISRHPFKLCSGSGRHRMHTERPLGIFLPKVAKTAEDVSAVSA